jgi:hypothetical protein
MSQRNTRKVFGNNTRHPTKAQTPETGKRYDGFGQGERRVEKRKEKSSRVQNGTATNNKKMEDKILEICVYYPPPNPSIRVSPIDIHNLYLK